jgi:hypothetical protein
MVAQVHRVDFAARRKAPRDVLPMVAGAEQAVKQQHGPATPLAAGKERARRHVSAPPGAA